MTTLPSPVLLHLLPASHPARHTPLRELRAQVRNLQSPLWRDVATWKIGPLTYHQLGPVWTDLNEFRLPPVAPG